MRLNLGEQTRLFNFLSETKKWCYEVAVLGGLGSGKTYSGSRFVRNWLLSLIDYSRKIGYDKKIQFCVLAASHADLIRISFPNLISAFEEVGAQVRFKSSVPPVMEFENLQCWGFSAQKPESIKGDNACGFWADEPFLYPDEDVFRRITGRIRQDANILPSLKLYTGTPEPGNTYAADWMGGFEKFIIPTVENVSNVGKRYIEDLKKVYTEQEQRAYLYGEPIKLTASLVYYAFGDENIINSSGPLGSELVAGVDFNVTPYCCALFRWCGEVLVQVDEIILQNANTLRMIDEIKKRAGRALVTVYPDGNQGRHTGDYWTDYAADYHQFQEAGFQLVYEMNPLQRTRTETVNKAFESRRVLIMDNCRETIRMRNALKWQNGKLPHDNHLTDAGDYAIYNIFKCAGTRRGRQVR
jgi:hypothetical protein